MEYLVSVLIILLFVTYLLSLYLLAVKAEERMMKYFDTKWLPPPEKRLRKIPKGARLLLVKVQDKQAVILWTMLTTEATLLALSLVVGILLALFYLGGWYLAYWRTDGNVSPASVRELVLLLTTPFFALQLVAVAKYWLAEWERRRARHIVRSDEHDLIDMKPTLVGFIFGRAPKYQIVTERTELLKRAVTAADIQQLKPEYRTPWLRDQISYLLAGRRGVGSALLPSETYGDLDTMRWVADVNGYVACLHRFSELAAAYRQSDERAGFFSDMKMFKEWEDSGGSADDAERARLELLGAHETLKERRAPEMTIDIFDVVDPGLCRGGELKIEEEEMPAVISIAPRMGHQPPVQGEEITPASTEGGKTKKEGEEDSDLLPRSKLV